MVNRCYLCGEEEYFDHILLYFTRQDEKGLKPPALFFWSSLGSSIHGERAVA